MNYLMFSIFYLLFSALAWKRLNWAVLFVVAALPSYLIRFNLGPIPMTFLEGMIIIVFLAWTIHKILLYPHIRFCAAAQNLINYFSTPLLLFLIAATVSMFITPDLRAAAGIWKAYFIEPILFFFVLRDLLTRDNLSKQQIIFAFSLVALSLSVYAIYQRFTGFGIPAPWDTELRVTSIFPYPNALGLFLAPLVPLMISNLKLKIKNVKFYILHFTFYIIAITTSIIAIIFAKSTGAIVGLGAGLLIMAGFYFVQVYRTYHNESGITNHESWVGLIRKSLIHYSLFIIPLATIIALFAVVWFSSPRLRDELLLRDWSGHVRRTQWSETWEMLKDTSTSLGAGRPILGAGLAGYKETLAPYHKATYLEIFEYPHNIVLNFWSETGLLGLLAFLWLIIVFFKHTLKGLEIGNWKLGIPAMGAVAAMLTLLTHGLVDVPYFKNDLAILFWIVYTLGIANSQKPYASSNQTLQTH